MTTVFLLLSSLFLSCFSIPKYLLVETANSPKEQKKPHHHVSEDFNLESYDKEGSCKDSNGTIRRANTHWAGKCEGVCCDDCCDCSCKDGVESCEPTISSSCDYL